MRAHTVPASRLSYLPRQKTAILSYRHLNRQQKREELLRIAQLSAEEFDHNTKYNTNRFKTLIRENPSLVNTRNVKKCQTGTTLLMYCAGNNHIDLVKFLIERGANPWLQDLHTKNAIEYVDSENTNMLDILEETGLRNY